MVKRGYHQEVAFEHFLRDKNISYLAIDEAKRPVEIDKNFDFLVFTESKAFMVDVKGKQIPYRILHNHIKKKELKIESNTLKQVEKVLSEITDQTIIASSRDVEGASIRPRLRIMAEVHSEGNPHSSNYPQISDKSFNLILKSTPQTEKIKNMLLNELPELSTFTIKHKRNGDHIVLQFRLTS